MLNSVEVRLSKNIIRIGHTGKESPAGAINRIMLPFLIFIF